MQKPANHPKLLRNLVIVSALGVVSIWFYAQTTKVSLHQTEKAALEAAVAPNAGALQSGPVEFDAVFKNVSSGRCIDLNRYLVDNSYPVQQWDCNNTANQRLWADAVPKSNYYRLRFDHSGKCLEPASNQAGAQLQQWVCHSGDIARPAIAASAQYWTLNDLGQGRLSLTHVDSGLAMSSTSSVNGSVFTLNPLNNSAAQQFELTNRIDHESNPAIVGSWGKLIAWPHVPVHAAITPANNVVTWASNETNNYPQDTGNKFSWSSVYNPSSDSFLATNNPAHDMFCAGTSMLDDGSLLASGGNPRASETSLFNANNNTWSLTSSMSQARWYGSNVTTGSGDVFTSFAKGAQETAELFDSGTQRWNDVPAADMSVLRDEQDLGNAKTRANGSATLQWYSFLHASPDGRVIQTGPMKNMHWFETKGEGAIQPAGNRTDDDRYRQFGSAVMYDVGKLLLTGGSDPTVAGEFSPDDREIELGSTNTAMIIDVSAATPIVEAVAPMNARRANHNSVVLPNGEVYVLGGTALGALFDDRYTAWWPEIWNPDTRQWRTVAALSTPRSYHSWALLMQDGRVLSGGGGLCGDCSANHPDAQIYTPPYLYRPDGQLATRPQILSGSTLSRAGGLLSISTDKLVNKFNMVRLSSVTHSINNDQRFIPLKAQHVGNKRYLAQLSSNVNVLVPGMYWVFAVDVKGVPSQGHLLQIQSTDVMQKSALLGLIPEEGLELNEGMSFELRLPSEGFDQNDLRFSAINLPDGLSLHESTGLISGQVNAIDGGSFIVSYSDGNIQTTERIDYKVIPQSEGSVSISGGGILWLPLLLVFSLGCRRQY